MSRRNAIERRARPLAGCLALLAGALSAGGAAADAPTLSAPLICDPGRNCWVSTFYDHDPGPGHKDQNCGPVTYDTHGGIDFAIPNLADMEAGVTVVASAPGTVVGTRNDMPDISIRDREPGSLGGKDCGNGVRIDHGDGWATQYCHLRQGSIAVGTGDRVETGTALGLVGLSGRTEHPHVHVTLSKDGEKIDPYTGTGPQAACSERSGSYWHADVLENFPYRTGLVRDLVFSTRVPERREVQAGTAGESEGSKAAEVLVLSAETMANLRDHTIEMTIHAPAGQLVVEKTYDQPKVYSYFRIGRKIPKQGWPEGRYTGKITIRDGAGTVTDAREIAIDLR